ncbi:MAG: polysaccharide biosynthesis C-terminal domain-containing protein [Candidatus Nomurabacteria bacterium]|nr:MAG: polysaccharide biosynthesis C-terminal domain-containing protein [Candidatus Nomurabacteria bacterium]
MAMVNYTALLSLGKVKFNFYTVLIEALVNIVLNYWLISQLGMIGAAWATVVTFALRYGINSFFLRRQLKTA